MEVDDEAPLFEHGGDAAGIKCSVVTVDAAATALAVDAHENRQRTSVDLGGALARSPACTVEAKERLQAATPRFTKTVEDVLRLVRVLSFA